VEGFTYNYYEDLTPKDACDIIDTLRKGEHRQAAILILKWRGYT
jgi:hypothetical protein